MELKRNRPSHSIATARMMAAITRDHELDFSSSDGPPLNDREEVSYTLEVPDRSKMTPLLEESEEEKRLRAWETEILGSKEVLMPFSEYNIVQWKEGSSKRSEQPLWASLSR